MKINQKNYEADGGGTFGLYAFTRGHCEPILGINSSPGKPPSKT
jgi:hypothetical protein